MNKTITLTKDMVKVKGTDNIDKYVEMFVGTYKLKISITFNNVKVLNYNEKDNIRIISDFDYAYENYDESLILSEWYTDGRVEFVSFIDDDKLRVIAYDAFDNQIVVDEHVKIKDNLYLSKYEIMKIAKLQNMYYNSYHDDDSYVTIDIDCDDMIIDVDDTIKIITIKSNKSHVEINVYEKIQ
ncbi:MAG: hypothetical protein QXX12_02460 [Nanopusillaceae archaeon]